MNSLQKMMLICLLQSSLSYSMQEAVIGKVVIDNNAFMQATEVLLNKTTYTIVGTTSALCGCFLTTLGLKKTFTDDHYNKKNLYLTGSGVAIVLIGLNIALNK